MSEQQPPWNPYGQQGQESCPGEMYAPPGAQAPPPAQPLTRDSPTEAGTTGRAQRSCRGTSASRSQDGRSRIRMHSSTSGPIRVSRTRRPCPAAGTLRTGAAGTAPVAPKSAVVQEAQRPRRANRGRDADRHYRRHQRGYRARLTIGQTSRPRLRLPAHLHLPVLLNPRRHPATTRRWRGGTTAARPSSRPSPLT